MHIYGDNFFYVWLVASILFLLLEMGSPGLFYFLSFFVGGLAAAIAALWSDSLFMQAITFFVGSISALFVLRHGIIPALSKGRSHERTNMYALIGKRAIVVEGITRDKPGFVIIEGSRWVAQSVSGELIVRDSVVEIVRVRGAHVVVKKCNNDR